ncbi:serine/threonine-protein kinase [Streptomyces lycii]|uniref:non-specific serine/threonine protein kinase n=1 Tax=Streptomyces lycii TaxID=2654337 RepID=A0ABQ7FG20_9ACTN|nr:serine/threonine-protein kinase [Streptomyces lycii]KAF4407552.1 serine/threonine protein kinase [Streptomyces lycii]
MPELIGDRYRLSRTIGAGGMGTVYEAEDLALSRRVAVKMLSSATLTSDMDPLRRFRLEGRALARINHPHVVTVYDLGAHEGTPYLVMELLDGDELHGLVTAHGRLAPELVRAVAHGMAAGLAAAHAAGVLHRDIKPTNVRVAASGRVVLQDFGLARLAEESAITRVGALVGTPQFMAPEVIRGDRPGPGADLYSVGLCMYWMLTGEPPLGHADDIGPLVERAVSTGVPRLRETRPEVPAPLAEIVDRLASRNPEDRPHSAAAVQELLGEPPDTGLLAEFMGRHIRKEAVERAGGRPGAARPQPSRAPLDSSFPEYLDSDAGPPVPGMAPLSLSDATRQIVMSSLTPQNATSRLREAVTLVQRGEFQEAMRMLTAVTQICASSLGDGHPTTLAGRYWQGVCLARLGAKPEALALFSTVRAHTGTGRDGKDG